MPRHKKKTRKKQQLNKAASGIRKKGWYRITFQLAGNLHVGSGRWGFVLPARPYLPGWTLWGALTVFLKQSGRWQGDWGEIGNRLNEECWLGHFFLKAAGTAGASCYLPAIQQGGAIRYCRQNGKQKKEINTDLPELRPMVFRHGVTRSSSGSTDDLGRLFLHEMVRFDRNNPFQLQGLIFWKGTNGAKFPLAKGDILRVGGNRQVSGAEILCQTILSWKPKKDLARHHLQFADNLPGCQATGNLERIVLRRTRDTSKEDNKGRFRGFGQHFVDWGDHLAPGWEMAGAGALEPVFGSDGYRHGTVRLEGD